MISINLDEIPNKIISSKFSYHQSGKIHIKEKDLNLIEKYIFISEWLKPQNIDSPKHIFSILSRPIGTYEIYTENVLKNKTFAMALRYNRKFISSRCIFEFYLSPPGTFKIKDFMIKNSNNLELKTFSLNQNLILVFKNSLAASNSKINSWHPDKEIIIFKDNLD